LSSLPDFFNSLLRESSSPSICPPSPCHISSFCVTIRALRRGPAFAGACSALLDALVDICSARQPSARILPSRP
jgi:hypothetical protein